jgi:hypothetical protein
LSHLADIELGHFYLAHLLEGKQEINLKYFRRGLRRAEAMKEDGWDIQYSILVDDLGDVFSDQERAIASGVIRSALAECNITDCKITMESEFKEKALILIAMLRENYLITAEGGARYLALVTQDQFLWAQETLESPKSIKRIFLDRLGGQTEIPGVPSQSQFLVPIHDPKDSLRPFGCSILTAVWYLVRLGVDGFSTLNVRPDRLVNILPIKYLKSEGFAFDLLRISSAARVRKAAERIEYVLL